VYGQTAVWIKVKLGMQVGLGPGHIVLDGELGTQLLPKGAEPPIFGPYVLCQMAGWIKMPLGTLAGLGTGDFVLDGDPAPLSKKGAEPASPIFGPCLWWQNGWMDQDGTWYGDRHRARQLYKNISMLFLFPVKRDLLFTNI